MSDQLVTPTGARIDGLTAEPVSAVFTSNLGLAGGPNAEDPGSDLGSAFDLGNPTEAATVLSGNVSNFDTIDTYRFTISSNSNINLSLTGLSNNADLKLLDSNGFQIGASTKLSTSDELINFSGRPAGTYYAQVNSVNGANANYTLGLSTSNPSNLLGIESELGNLNGSRTISGVNIGNDDTADVFNFSVLGGASKNLQVLLNGLSADADIRIVRDNNGNRVFDPSDQVLGSGTKGGTAVEEFNITLPSPGDYFAQVYQFSGTTNYNLTLNVL